MYLFSIKHQISKFIVIVSIALSLSNIAQATPNDAANFVNDLASRVITIVKSTDLTDSEKESRLDDIFVQAVDTKWIGRFSLGRYWRNITPAQQNQFLDLYTKYLTGLYVPNFRKYTGNVIKVTDSKEVGPGEYLVQTTITDVTNSTNIQIGYRLLQNDKELEKFVIFDIIAEGVSLITTQRAELSSVMANGDFNALIDLLSQKTASSKKN